MKEWLAEHIVKKYHRGMAKLCDGVSFSVAEMIIVLAIIGLLAYITARIILIVRAEKKGKKIAFSFLYLFIAFIVIYGGYTLLWGVYYDTQDFAADFGLSQEEISVEDLAYVTSYFAYQANAYGALVARDENGLYLGDEAEIFKLSEHLYDNISEEMPALRYDYVKPKPIHFSRVMSMLDFTGFFFPFTGEANLNVDSPLSFLPVTIAHEMSHQRSVAPEQEANFVAVVSCMEYGQVDYCYSASLLAYIHLGNALKEANEDAWRIVAQSLSDEVWADLNNNTQYWKQFEHTIVKETSNKVYEGFLQSYGQTMGLRSYGACVDLLVNYYAPRLRTNGI